MTRRSLTDEAWAAEVVRRWQRRRWGQQKMDRAMAELEAAFLPLVERLPNWLIWLFGGSRKR